MLLIVPLGVSESPKPYVVHFRAERGRLRAHGKPARTGKKELEICLFVEFEIVFIFVLF